MITRAKRHRSSNKNSTATADQKPLPRSDRDEVVSQPPPSRTKGKRKTRDNDITSNSDAHGTGDTDEILHHHQGASQPHRLPNKIVSLIIHQLSHQERNTLYECTLVTKQFHAITNPFLWQVLNFDNNHICSKRFISCLYQLPQQRQQTLRQYIRDLRLYSPQWTEARLSRLLPNMPHLKHFSLYPKTLITDKSFQHLPHYCQHLTSLQLDSTRLTQVSFTAIGQYCHQLDDLEWKVAKNESPEWLALLVRCPLKRLQLDLTQPQALTENVMKTIQQLHDLTCLAIGVASIPINRHLLLPTTNSNNKDDDEVTTMLWPQLTSLTLSPCNDIDDATLIPFIQSHPHLQELKLMNVRQLTDVTLNAMAGCLLNLAQVTLMGSHHFSSEAVQRFKQHSGVDQLHFPCWDLDCYHSFI